MSKSSFERVVGNISESEKEKVLQGKEEQFDNQQFEELLEKERGKTPIERQIIALANRETNRLRQQYGLDDFDIPAANIHVISEDAWPAKKAEVGAFYTPMHQGVAMRDHPSSLSFLARAFHEMLHFKSYQALQVTTGPGAKLEEYRTGLVVQGRDGQHTYFTNLNEAVTEELATRFVLKHRYDPLFLKETRQMQTLRKQYPHAVGDKSGNLFKDDTYYAQLLEKPSWREAVGRLFGMPERSKRIMTMNFTYRREREMLNTLVDRLFTQNKAAFTDREQVFDMFVGGMMRGTLLPLGRLIDSTFGKGTFRKLGELDSDINAQTEFVRKLAVSETPTVIEKRMDE